LTRKQALGLAVTEMASFLGQEAVGSDRFAEALRDSLGYAGEYQDDVEALIRFIAAENAERELTGKPLHGNPQKRTMEADAEAIRQVDFAAICKVRDVLSLLAEAGIVYRAAKKRVPDDPMMRRLADFFTSSYKTHMYVRMATPLTYTAPADSWKWMASVIVMICTDPDGLVDFEEMANRIDFTLDDIHDFVSRSAAARKERS
jgi:hypothetical protein